METLNKSSFNRILIIQTAFLGDVLLTLPIIHHLRKARPDYKISILVKSELKEIQDIYPYAEFLFIDKSSKVKSIIETVKIIRKKYDIVISPHRSYRSAIISYLSKTPIRISFDKSSLNFVYTHVIKYQSRVHEIERNLSLIEPIIGKVNWKEQIRLNLLNYVFNEEFMNWKNRNDKVIVVAPGTVWETKRYPEYYYAILIRKLIDLGFKVVLIGTSNEFELGYRIVKYIKNDYSLLNLVGKLSLKESISLIQLSDLLICNDSAPTHMGVFTETPIITIYGSTVPEFGFYPFREKDKIMQVENLPCKPCGIHGYKKCPEKHFKCMLDLKPDLICEKVKEVLNIN